MLHRRTGHCLLPNTVEHKILRHDSHKVFLDLFDHTLLLEGARSWHRSHGLHEVDEDSKALSRLLRVVSLHVLEHNLLLVLTVNRGRHDKEDVAQEELESLSIIVSKDCFNRTRLLLKHVHQAIKDASIV